MATVRIFAYRGMREITKIEAKQYSADSVYQLDQPYLWRQALDISGGDAVSSSADNTSGVTMLRIEVPDGIVIGYEINREGGVAVADADSPRLRGNDQFTFMPGWALSVIDLTNVA